MDNRMQKFSTLPEIIPLELQFPRIGNLVTWMHDGRWYMYEVVLSDDGGGQRHAVYTHHHRDEESALQEAEQIVNAHKKG